MHQFLKLFFPQRSETSKYSDDEIQFLVFCTQAFQTQDTLFLPPIVKMVAISESQNTKEDENLEPPKVEIHRENQVINVTTTPSLQVAISGSYATVSLPANKEHMIKINVTTENDKATFLLTPPIFDSVTAEMEASDTVSTYSTQDNNSILEGTHSSSTETASDLSPAQRSQLHSSEVLLDNKI
jgi:hypothetical protein